MQGNNNNTNNNKKNKNKIDNKVDSSNIKDESISSIQKNSKEYFEGVNELSKLKDEINNNSNSKKKKNKNSNKSKTSNYSKKEKDNKTKEDNIGKDKVSNDNDRKNDIASKDNKSNKSKNNSNQKNVKNSKKQNNKKKNNYTKKKNSVSKETVETKKLEKTEKDTVVLPEVNIEATSTSNTKENKKDKLDKETKVISKTEKNNEKKGKNSNKKDKNVSKGKSRKKENKNNLNKSNSKDNADTVDIDLTQKLEITEDSHNETTIHYMRSKKNDDTSEIDLDLSEIKKKNNVDNENTAPIVQAQEKIHADKKSQPTKEIDTEEIQPVQTTEISEKIEKKPKKELNIKFIGDLLAKDKTSSIGNVKLVLDKHRVSSLKAKETIHLSENDVDYINSEYKYRKIPWYLSREIIFTLRNILIVGIVLLLMLFFYGKSFEKFYKDFKSDEQPQIKNYSTVTKDYIENIELSKDNLFYGLETMTLEKVNFQYEPREIPFDNVETKRFALLLDEFIKKSNVEVTSLINSIDLAQENSEVIHASAAGDSEETSNEQDINDETKGELLFILRSVNTPDVINIHQNGIVLTTENDEKVVDSNNQQERFIAIPIDFIIWQISDIYYNNYLYYRLTTINGDINLTVMDIEETRVLTEEEVNALVNILRDYNRTGKSVVSESNKKILKFDIPSIESDNSSFTIYQMSEEDVLFVDKNVSNMYSNNSEFAKYFYARTERVEEGAAIFSSLDNMSSVIVRVISNDRYISARDGIKDEISTVLKGSNYVRRSSIAPYLKQKYSFEFRKGTNTLMVLIYTDYIVVNNKIYYNEGIGNKIIEIVDKY